MLDNTAESQLQLLQFYTGLLRRWAVGILSSDQELDAGRATTTALLEHVNRLALTLLQTTPSAATHMAVLGFYEQFAAMVSHPGILEKIQVTIPPPDLVFTLHFSQSPAVLSRLYLVLAAYKQSWETIMSRASRRQLTSYERDHVQMFNGFLMDVCNCLWRGKAFNPSDTNALGCRVPQSLVSSLASYVMRVDSELALTSLFGLSYSPALALQSISYMRELEDAEEDEITVRHGGPVTQDSLARLESNGGLSLDWQDYREGVLGYLQESNLEGIPELMYNTMKNLKNSRAAELSP